jgi:hypothetical protein
VVTGRKTFEVQLPKEKMSPVGYEFLRQSLHLTAFPPEFPALVRPVTRIEPADTFLAIPRQVAPDTKDPVAHVLFALKHEGTNLQILAEAMPRIDAASLLAELRQSPTGGYIRTACYLWEEFSSSSRTRFSPTQLTGPPATAESRTGYAGRRGGRLASHTCRHLPTWRTP